MIKMAFTDKDYKQPIRMFDSRTRQLRVRIQHLEAELAVVNHPFSKAVVQQELQKTIDEYVARKAQEGD